MSKSSLTDCSFFIYSGFCTKPGCEFRHSAAALANPVTCRYWVAGTCTNPLCFYRHPKTDEHRASTPCYWLTQPGGCAKGDSCPYSHQLGGSSANNNGSTTQEHQPEPQIATSPSTSRAPPKQNLPAEVLEKKKTTVLLQAAKQAAEDATKTAKAAEGATPKVINIMTGVDLKKRLEKDQEKREREEREAKEKAEREKRRSEIEARERQRREQQQKEQQQKEQQRQQKQPQSKQQTINMVKPPAAKAETNAQPPQPVKFGVKSLTDLIGDKKPASTSSPTAPIAIPTKAISIESPKTSVLSSSPSSVKRDAELISSSPASSKKQKLNTSIGAFQGSVSDFSTDDIDNELKELGVDVTDLGNTDFKDLDDIDIEE